MVIYLNLQKLLNPPQLKKNINGHYNYRLFCVPASSVYFFNKYVFTKCSVYSMKLLIVICSSIEHQSSSSEYHSSSSEQQSSSSEYHISSSEHHSSSSEHQSSSNDF